MPEVTASGKKTRGNNNAVELYFFNEVNRVRLSCTYRCSDAWTLVYVGGGYMTPVTTYAPTRMSDYI